jgi:SAM-dependent methyltransferase
MYVHHERTLDLQQNPYFAWSRWLESPPGRALLSLEQAWLNERLQDSFGYRALQIGPSALDALEMNRMPCRARVSFYQPQTMPAGANQLVCLPEALPIESESTDLIVMAHCLELISQPHDLLREAERVLIPDGRIVILGFNPFSLWALHRPTATTRFPPVEGHWLSLSRIKDWCRLLGLAPEAGASGLYRPLAGSEAWWNRLGWLESAGARWWPGLGAVYLLVAVKRREGLRMMRAGWKRRRSARAGVVATTRVAGQERRIGG